MRKYRVILADDEQMIRNGLWQCLSEECPELEFVGLFADGEEVIAQLQKMSVDLIITDIKMPYMDGLELGRRLHLTLPAAKLVFFSGFDDFEYARQAVGIHAFEYILKPISAREGIKYSSRRRSCPSATIFSSRAARWPTSVNTAPWYSDLMSSTRYSIGSKICPFSSL